MGDRDRELSLNNKKGLVKDLHGGIAQDYFIFKEH